AESTLREGLVQVAKQGLHSPVLAEGLLSRELRIYAVTRANGQRQFVSEDQAGKEPQWKQKDEVKPVSRNKEDQDRYLTLTADRARELDLVVVRDYEDYCGKYGLNAAKVETADNDWLDLLADFLRNPWTSVVLVMVGITCLILELKMPGVSLP